MGATVGGVAIRNALTMVLTFAVFSTSCADELSASLVDELADECMAEGASPDYWVGPDATYSARRGHCTKEATEIVGYAEELGCRRDGAVRAAAYGLWIDPDGVGVFGGMLDMLSWCASGE